MRTEDLAALGVECVELAQGVSFIMGSPSLLSVTGYKVLRSQEPGRYVPCVRSRINGHEKLTYLTAGAPTLASCLEGAAAPAGRRLLRSLVEAVQAVEDNGFLLPRSILVDPERIYVDASTGACQLVCLPLTRYLPGGDLEAKQSVFDLCASACATLFGTSSPLSGIERSVEYRTGSLGTLREALSRGAHDATPAFGRTASERPARAESAPSRPADHGPVPRAPWRLVPARSGVPEVTLTSASAVLGKSPTKADLVIAGNPAISRAHCRLCAQPDATLTVEDLGSANGTFVNGARIASGRPVTLGAGDRLTLANAEYTVTRGW